MCRIVGLTVTTRGEPSARPGLIVANHISWLEIMALGSVLPVSFVSKAEIRGWPIFGWMADAGGTVFIPRGANQAAEVVRQVSERLAGGCHVVVFPEGTTSDGREVRRFYPRLFAAAVDTGCSVQPVAVTFPSEKEVHPVAPFIDDDPFFDHLMRVLAAPEVGVELIFCEGFEAAGRDRRGVSNQARDAIVAALSPNPGSEAAGA